jgi:hypothetical protein
MKLLSILFLASLLLGQIGGITLWSGVVVYVHDILLLLLLIASLPKFVRTIKLSHVKLIKPVAIFIAAAMVSLLVNYWRFPLPELLTGSLYLVRWVLYAALYVLILQKYVAPKLWLKGLYAVGVGLGLIGFIQFFMYPDLRNLMYLGWDPHYYRLFSTLLDPNFTGIILVFTLLLGFGVLTKKHCAWVMAGQLITLVALLLTYSRSSYLALCAAIVVWASMKKQRRILITVVLFIGLIFIFPAIPGGTLKLTRLDSTLARIGNWHSSLTLIAKVPVCGYGFNTLRYVQPSTPDFTSKAAAGLDSSILFVLATTGLLGLAAYIFLFASMIRLGNRTGGTVYVATVSALLVHSLFVNSMFYPWVMIWIWILTGASIYDT